MRSLKYTGQQRGSYNVIRSLKLMILYVIVVYLFLQMIITAQTAGISFEIRRGRSLGRQYFQENTTAASFVRKRFNNSIPKDVDFKLTRFPVTKNSHISQSTCSRHVHLLRGYQRNTKGFLTLGLSSVPREGAFYLPKALDSLTSQMADEDRNEVVIVLFLASHNASWVKKTLSMIDTQFVDSVSTGLIQVVQPDPSIYPDFNTITKRNYNDTLSRVHWRTKQNVDYAYLFAYCEKVSEYYMHIEDDITAASGYINKIKTFVAKTDKSKQTWFLLEFSSLGFIGKLFRSSDMCTMKEYFLLFKDEKSCDLLINDLKHIKTQIKDIRSPKSLFQHFGIASSLKGKQQNLTDRHFKDHTKPHNAPLKKDAKDLSVNFKTTKFVNPSAQVITSMKAFGSFTSLRPYDLRLGGYFWAITPNANDFYRILFHSPINIPLVQIKTGHPSIKIDKLENADVKAGHNKNDDKCENDIYLGSFKNGEFSAKFNKPLQSISCLEIIVNKKQMLWMIMYEITIQTTRRRK